VSLRKAGVPVACPLPSIAEILSDSCVQLTSFAGELFADSLSAAARVHPMTGPATAYVLVLTGASGDGKRQVGLCLAERRRARCVDLISSHRSRKGRVKTNQFPGDKKRKDGMSIVVTDFLAAPVEIARKRGLVTLTVARAARYLAGLGRVWPRCLRFGRRSHLAHDELQAQSPEEKKMNNRVPLDVSAFAVMCAANPIGQGLSLMEPPSPPASAPISSL
jgi:hypothetical protein